jgi:hypothetical protein
MIDK